MLLEPQEYVFMLAKIGKFVRENKDNTVIGL